MGIKKIINKDVTKDFDFSCFHLRLNRLPSAKQRCAIACVDSVLWRQFPAILFVNQSKGDDANGFFPRNVTDRSAALVRSHMNGLVPHKGIPF